MNNEIIALPPPGGAIVLHVDVLAAAHAGPEHQGLILSRDGCLVICAGGGGMGAKLTAAQAAALAQLLAKIAGELAEQSQAAATAAREALDRITHQVAGNA